MGARSWECRGTERPHTPGPDTALFDRPFMKHKGNTEPAPAAAMRTRARRRPRPAAPPVGLAAEPQDAGLADHRRDGVVVGVEG